MLSTFFRKLFPLQCLATWFSGRAPDTPDARRTRNEICLLRWSGIDGLAHRCYRVSLIIDRCVLAVKGILALSLNYWERWPRPLPHLPRDRDIARAWAMLSFPCAFIDATERLPEVPGLPFTCVFSAVDGPFARSCARLNRRGADLRYHSESTFRGVKKINRTQGINWVTIKCSAWSAWNDECHTLTYGRLDFIIFSI